jgi:hypothetical protein
MVLSVGERDKENEKGVSEKRGKNIKSKFAKETNFLTIKDFPKANFCSFLLLFNIT